MNRNLKPQTLVHILDHTNPQYTRIYVAVTTFLCTYQCKAGGGRGDEREMGRDLSVTVGPGVGHLTDFAFPGKGLFEPVFALRGAI